jgi:hypothetical protein
MQLAGFNSYTEWYGGSTSEYKKEVITFLKSEMQIHYSLWLYMYIVLYTCSTILDGKVQVTSVCQPGHDSVQGENIGMIIRCL